MPTRAPPPALRPARPAAQIVMTSLVVLNTICVLPADPGFANHDLHAWMQGEAVPLRAPSATREWLGMRCTSPGACSRAARCMPPGSGGIGCCLGVLPRIKRQPQSALTLPCPCRGFWLSRRFSLEAAFPSGRLGTAGRAQTPSLLPMPARLPRRLCLAGEGLATQAEAPAAASRGAHVL